jgi:hypothetical protein
MDRRGFADWIARYEHSWRTAGTDHLAALFTADATYLVSPWAAPISGLAAIAQLWDAEREGPDEQFAMDAEIVAVDGDTGVARLDVRYATGDRWRDLWIVQLDTAGRCRHFEEWPIAPNDPDGHAK